MSNLLCVRPAYEFRRGFCFITLGAHAQRGYGSRPVRGVRHERKSRTLWQKSIGNQLEITEIWLEIRNQDPVEIRKSATPPFCLSMRSRPFAHAHLRNPREISVTRREISWKSVGNQLEITAKAGNQLEITEIRKSRTLRRPVSYPSVPCVCVSVCPGLASATHATTRPSRHTYGLSIVLAPE